MYGKQVGYLQNIKTEDPEASKVTIRLEQTCDSHKTVCLNLTGFNVSIDLQPDRVYSYDEKIEKELDLNNMNLPKNIIMKTSSLDTTSSNAIVITKFDKI
ncbi:DhNV_040 [Dikerogammarus haemobaphes nudivirus]|nr:DhNV_040 [Dikerogammarus haemobaphes nudivirus]